MTIAATTITRKNTNCKLAAVAKCTHQVLAQFSSRSRSHTFPCPRRRRRRKSALFSEKIVFLSPRLLTLFLYCSRALSLSVSLFLSRSFSLSISLFTFSGDFHFWLALFALTFPPFTVHVAKQRDASYVLCYSNIKRY